MRVYEVARELDVESKYAIAKFQEIGVDVTSHANTVSDEDVARLKEYLAEGEAAEAAEPEEAPEAEAKKAEEPEEEAPEPAAKKAEEPAKPEAEAEEPEEEVAEPEAEADEKEAPEPAAARPVAIEDGITVRGLADETGLKPADIIRELMGRGIMANVNQALDAELAVEIAGALGATARVKGEEEELLGVMEVGDAEDRVPRAPVVTIMGHVDHGKTQLLDSIRETRVAAREAGGITQHIGASQIEWQGNRIVFIDTPGHEAFTRMRARGAQVTDIVVLVVAADDGVMPQTVEAIDHARAAGVPIIVAINKIDLPQAKPDRVLQQLSERELVPEEWGGETICVQVSAKEKQNLEDLLEMIVLQAELLELTANPEIPARGVVLEGQLDRQRGPVATLLVQEGTVRVGDSLIAGPESAKVRALTDDRGDQVEEAGPATPVEVLGFSGVPQAGDTFQLVEEKAVARKVAEMRQDKRREEQLSSGTRLTLEDLHQRLREGEKVTVPVILKADARGSVETLRDALEKLSTDDVQVEIIRAGVGGVSENDVLLAAASDALIVGFNVRPERNVADAAKQEGVELRLYTVIYQLIDDVKQAMVGKLEPEYEERSAGIAEVRETFNVPRAGTVAGCYVTNGKFTRKSRVRLVRDSKVVYEGRVASLRRFKDDVSEVQQGYECGIGLENFNDIKIGDQLEAYELEEIAPEL